jgi:hypothetical protein
MQSTFEAGEIVDWTDSTRVKTTPPGTSITVEYGDSGNWYSSIENIPNSTKIRLKITLSTTDTSEMQMTGLSIKGPRVYKARKFACRSLKGKGAHSGIRVIYAYIEQNDKIELIEIYYKGDKENEDRERILTRYG